MMKEFYFLLFGLESNCLGDGAWALCEEESAQAQAGSDRTWSQPLFSDNKPG